MSDFLCDICDRSLAKFVTPKAAYCGICYRDEVLSQEIDD